MKPILAVVLFSLVAAPVQQQEEWLDEMRKMDDMVTKIQGPTYLLRSLRQEMLRACRALDESRLDLVDKHLLRLAHVSRPYNHDHATRVVGIAHALRTEIRQEGVTRVQAVADFLKAGKTKEAEAFIDETLNTAYLATTYRAEFERLKEWLKKPPEPATVDAEIARWRAMMPPGSLNNCGSCKGTGESACVACQMGSVEQECRSCKASGTGPCGMCSGKGKVPHGGFTGDLYLVVEKDFKIPQLDSGGKPTGKHYSYPAQKIHWTLKPCGGKNSIQVHGRASPFDPKKEKTDKQVTCTCGDLFYQLKIYVFSGSAKLYSRAEAKKEHQLTVEQVKKMFAEYESCATGRVACDACEGKGIGKCGPCGAKGRRLGLCFTCSGSGAEPCPVCKASGDSAWLADKVPVANVPALGACLNKHYKALNSWQDRRSRAISRRVQVRLHLADASKDLDPTAKLTPDAVNVTCRKCAGKGGKCEACWGAGRVEYFAGTPEHDKYEKARKLKEQLAVLSRGSLGVSSAEIELHIDDDSIEKWKAPPPSAAEPPKPAPPGVGSGVGGAIAELPEELQENIKKADALVEEGKKAYELAAGAGDDNEKRSVEANKAKKALKEAMELYSRTIEALDERGINTPKALSERHNTCLQALKLARNMAF